MTILVPYRNREEHLKDFIPLIRKQKPDCSIVVVEQADNLPFNRAKLINAGFLETQPLFFIAHDVDMLPVTADYEARTGVTQLAGSKIQLRDYLGGVTMYDCDVFNKVGGYNNDYWHRAEDNEMRKQLRRLSIPVLELHGDYEVLEHARTGPEFDDNLWLKSHQPRKVQNQLKQCRYNVIKRIQHEHYLHLRVIL